MPPSGRGKLVSLRDWRARHGLRRPIPEIAARPARAWPRRRPGPRTWVTVLLALVLAALWIRLEGGLLSPRAADGSLVRIIDGDSLRLGGREIRLVGYDAPEWSQICQSAVGLPWPCGLEARRELSLLVRAGGLACSPQGRDAYGRTLASCRAADGDVGAAMVRAGLGLRSRHSPFRYQAEETEARRAGRGMWQASNEHPEDYRRRRSS